MTYKSFVQAIDGETVGEAALRRIRFDIIQGRLAPGARLRLERMREAYGVSVTTLREILNRLQAEQLVVAEGQRGFEAAPVSAEELRDIAGLRLLLETHALRLSMAAGDLHWEARVVSTHHMLRATEEKLIGGEEGQVATWVQYDWDFHHATISACASPAIMAAHSSAFDRYLRYHLLALSFRGRPAADQHVRLRDLVVARREADATALLADHVRAGMEHILGAGKIPG